MNKTFNAGDGEHRITSIYLSVKMMKEMDAEAKALGLTRTDVVRIAWREYQARRAAE